ncbi:MAG: hypothetical protein JXA78_16960 [Anaerolineales bacterium]|nr:hypothetical protein [Anaerolineales bacterium]
MDPVLLQADELGIRLEIVGGLPIWEAKPARPACPPGRDRTSHFPGRYPPGMWLRL